MWHLLYSSVLSCRHISLLCPFRKKAESDRNIFGSSVQCVDAFRIASTEEPEVFIQQKHGQDRQQSMDLTEEQDFRHRDGITLLSMLLHIA